MTVAPSAGESSRGYHRLAQFMLCPRRYAYKYILLLRPITLKEPLALGSMVHLARMHYYIGRMRRPYFEPLEPVEAMRQAPARIAWVFAKAKMIWERYAAWMVRNDYGEVLDVEREYKVLLGGVLFTMRLDLVYEHLGKVWVDDAKTTGGNLPYHYRVHERSGQMVHAEALGRALLPGMYGMPYGGITVTAISSRDDLDGDAAVRMPLHIEEHLSRNFLSGTPWHAQRLVAMEEQMAERSAWEWPCNPEACRDQWGVCDYIALCERGEIALREFIQTVDEASDLSDSAGK